MEQHSTPSLELPGSPKRVTLRDKMTSPHHPVLKRFADIFFLFCTISCLGPLVLHTVGVDLAPDLAPRTLPLYFKVQLITFIASIFGLVWLCARYVDPFAKKHPACAIFALWGFKAMMGCCLVYYLIIIHRRYGLIGDILSFTFLSTLLISQYFDNRKKD